MKRKAKFFKVVGKFFGALASLSVDKKDKINGNF
tara:strand:- start:306 stop:407 length:102 start_codon:yes stop_codon:yes gene_type:complete